MKDSINKKLIAIVGTACICIVAIVGALVTVVNHEDPSVNRNDGDKIEAKTYGKELKNDVTNNFSFTGDDNTNSNTNSSNENFGENEVVKCNRQILIDPQTQVAVASVLVPDGWSTSCYVDWNTYVNESFPGRAFIEITSPNKEIDIQYVSKTSFLQSNSDSYVGNYHKDILNLVTQLNYMNAEEYTYHMYDLSQMTLKTSKEVYVDANRQDNIKKLAYDRGKATRDYWDQTIGASYRNSSMDGVIKLTDYDGRTFIQNGVTIQNGKEYYTESICEEYMYEITNTVTIGAELTGYFTSDQISKYWEPYLFTVAMFSDEQTYNENYELYRFLVSNIILCKDFEYLNKVLGSQYVEMATRANIEISNYAHDIMMQYQQETMQQEDAWVQNFSDYIYDQTTYTMSDGSSVTVPTSADYVYSDGNEVIWSNTAFYDPGPGYEQIN